MKKFVRKFGMLIIAVLAVVLIAGLMIIEECEDRKLVIINDTDKVISEIGIYFSDEEGSIVGMLYENEAPVTAGEKVKLKYENTFDFSEYAGMMLTLIKFENGEEIAIDSGWFTGVFRGTVDMKFYKEDNDICFSQKAYTGIFRKTDTTNVNEVYTLDIVNGVAAEID